MCAGVHDCLVKSIMKSDMDLRRELLSQVVLSGGSTLFQGEGLGEEDAVVSCSLLSCWACWLACHSLYQKTFMIALHITCLLAHTSVTRHNPCSFYILFTHLGTHFNLNLNLNLHLNLR
jgi:hypothetical protein